MPAPTIEPMPSAATAQTDIADRVVEDRGLPVASVTLPLPPPFGGDVSKQGQGEPWRLPPSWTAYRPSAPGPSLQAARANAADRARIVATPFLFLFPSRGRPGGAAGLTHPRA